ncbi:unnamed protein product [Candidula unifasciata]|uniref:Uncharacterized protein n=1 Tax=Candidula unifasciata TaxID=100452 RepID=A0A8S3YGW8_9EUPU|nr:unnamed protein product [Candidula unifasciata]
MQSQATNTDRELRQPRDHRRGADDGYWMQKIWESPVVAGFLIIVQDVYIYLVSTDLLWQSVSQVKRNLAQSPCSTLLYMFLVLFGFLPFLCFFLFVCGTFILWLVCFIFCQAVAVVFAGALFGGMFFFIIVACCLMATALGLTVHMLSFLGQVYRVLAFNAPEAVAFLRQQLARLGIHLRLPEDDQT